MGNRKTLQPHKLSHYALLLCKKVELHADIFIMMMRESDAGELEYLKKIYLEPVKFQIEYLKKKIVILCEKGVSHE